MWEGTSYRGGTLPYERESAEEMQGQHQPEAYPDFDNNDHPLKDTEPSVDRGIAGRRNEQPKDPVQVFERRFDHSEDPVQVFDHRTERPEDPVQVFECPEGRRTNPTLVRMGGGRRPAEVLARSENVEVARCALQHAILFQERRAVQHAILCQERQGNEERIPASFSRSPLPKGPSVLEPRELPDIYPFQRTGAATSEALLHHHETFNRILLSCLVFLTTIEWNILPEDQATDHQQLASCWGTRKVAISLTPPCMQQQHQITW